MNAHMNPASEPKKIIIGITVIIALAVGIFFILTTNIKNNTTPIYGVYRIFSDDAAVKMYIEGQNTYIKLNEDKTIIYNTTINGKPKFNFEGTFTQRNNEIAIQWKDGKLPANLKIETKGDEQVIKIGSTLYKKERTGS